MTLSLTSRVVWGSNPGMLELLKHCLEEPRWGNRVFAALPTPESLPENWKQTAAFFRWRRYGSPFRASQHERDRDYKAAIEELQEHKPRGIALVYVGDGITRILAVIVPSHEGCYEGRQIARSLIEGILEDARQTQNRRVICLCGFQADLRLILRDLGFSGEGDTLERTV